MLEKLYYMFKCNENYKCIYVYDINEYLYLYSLNFNTDAFVNVREATAKDNMQLHLVVKELLVLLGTDSLLVNNMGRHPLLNMGEVLFIDFRFVHCHTQYGSLRIRLYNGLWYIVMSIYTSVYQGPLYSLILRISIHVRFYFTTSYLSILSIILCGLYLDFVYKVHAYKYMFIQIKLFNSINLFHNLLDIWW